MILKSLCDRQTVRRHHNLLAKLFRTKQSSQTRAVDNSGSDDPSCTVGPTVGFNLSP